MKRREIGRRSVALALAAVGLLLQGATGAQAQEKAPTDPTEFLKWSMSRYAALSSFQADCDWSDSFGGPQKVSSHRTLAITLPNRYKIVSQQLGSPLAMTLTTVCDGKTAVEYSNKAEMSAMKADVPTSVATAKSMVIQHPMFCGSMLYLFFGGAQKLPELADTKKQPIAFGPDAVVDGHTCKTVTFFVSDTYGKTEVAISPEDGLVRRIRYGSEPLMDQVGQTLKGGKTTGLPTHSSSEEDYTHIVLNSTIPETAFDTTLPKGSKVLDLAGMGGQEEETPKPPVPLGKTAPNFTVKTLSGTKRSLADFRGQVVLIDFWATWCPPCRKGLPETQALAKAYGDKGLAVLAISDEEAGTVSPFLKSNHYNFPAYLDAGSKVSTAYHVEAIPTVVIVDRTGRLVTYLVGLQTPETIKAELKKAGLKLN